METKSTSITVADLCEQYKMGNITVNREYQRSSKVWPSAAKSYLIDTILSGYPIPKLAMHQKLDLANRRSFREIVDGQQRTLTVLDFYNDKLKLNGKTTFKGKTFSSLNEDEQRRFLEYGLTTDIFVGADENDIRQVFRRINSYNVPLNPEEQRHAKYQGRFKWLVVEIAETNTQALKNMGVFSETNISRMGDMKFYSEIALAVLRGIDHSQDAKLNRLYEEFDEEFLGEADFRTGLRSVLGWLIGAEEIYRTELVNAYQFYSILLALWHRAFTIPALNPLYSFHSHRDSLSDEDRSSLMNANDLILSKRYTNKIEQEFISGSEKATNRKTQREDRFKYFCTLLDLQ